MVEDVHPPHIFVCFAVASVSFAMKVSLEGVKTAAKKKKCATNKACKSVCITTL
jgi:hypothetical protein